MNTLEHHILTARVVYSGIGTARENGAVVTQGERIVMVGSLEDAQRSYPGAPVQDVGFAISPPPVNAHTHLDLSSLPFFRGSYTDFIRHVIAQPEARSVAAMEEGLSELAASGTPAFGDIVARDDVMRALLQKSAIQGVGYLEVFEPDPEKAEETFTKVLARLRELRRLEPQSGLKLGLSPHTPHTVSAALLQKVARLAVAEKLPLQIHVAESPEEIIMQERGAGPLFKLMKPFLGSWQPSGKTPVQYLAALGVLDARPTLVHMVHVTDEDIKTVARAGCTVVHCPRSNTALRCGRFPWERYAKHGVEIALGTDSRGSSPDLDIQREVEAAGKLHGSGVSPLALVRAAVKGGSRALGLTPPRFSRGDTVNKLYIWDRVSL